MKYSFKISKIDCPSCADRMEMAVSKLPFVENAEINFLTKKLNVEIAEEHFDETVKEINKAVSRIEPGCKIIS